LLYDADQYYARCSGVMVEMLKAGVPVIVPAACWMAEQIAEPIFRHRDQGCIQCARKLSELIGGSNRRGRAASANNV
jgi:hypothetical protein